MRIDANTSLDTLLEVAKTVVNELDPSDGEFLVKDLFKGVDWNRIPKGNRTKLGMYFLNYVSNAGADTIEKLGKTPQNQQKYRIKGGLENGSN